MLTLTSAQTDFALTVKKLSFEGTVLNSLA